MSDDIKTLDEQIANLKEIGEAEKNIKDVQSGMRSLAFEINKEMKKRNILMETGVGLSAKTELIIQAQNAAAQTATKEQQLQGKGAKIIWDMQKRITDEVESGSVVLRTQWDLAREYINEIGQDWKTLSDNQRTDAILYTKSIAAATTQYSSMSDIQLEIMNSTNQQLEEMSGKWVRIKKQVLDVTGIAKGLWNNPAIAGSIFGYQIFKRLKNIIGGMTEILDSGIGIQNVTSDLAPNMRSARFASIKYGATMGDVSKATNSIMNNMGSIEHATKDNIKGTIKLMKFYNMSADTAAETTKQFAQISSLTGKTNEQLRKSVVEMANLGKVAPTKIFQDLSNNAEATAKWLDKSGTNMIKLSVSSSQLGVSMSDTLTITEGLLDFSTSIEKQMQASVMTGKSFNFEQARMLTYAGKHNEALKSVISQLGTEAEWMNLNGFQRQAMADMLGVSISSLQTMIVNQEKLGKATGKWSKKWEEGYGWIKGTFSFINKDNLIMVASFMSILKNTGGIFKQGMVNVKSFFSAIFSGFKKTGNLARSAGSKIAGIFSKNKAEILPEGIGRNVKGKLIDKKSGRFVSENAIDKIKRPLKSKIDPKSLQSQDKALDKGMVNSSSKATDIDKSGGKGGIAGWIKSWDGVKWGSIAKIAVSLAIIGVAIWAFGKVIATLPTKLSAYIAVGSMLVMLITSVWLLSKIAKKIDNNGIFKATVAMALISPAIWLFGKAIATLPMNLTQLAMAGGMLVELVGSIWALAVIGQAILMPGIINGALAMAIIGAALIPFVFAMSLLAGVKWKTLGIMAVGLIVLTGAMIGLGALIVSPLGVLILAGIVGLIAMSVGLLIFGAALIVVGKGLDSLANINWKQLAEGAKSLLAFAGALLIAVPAMLITSAMLIPLSISLLIFGKTLGVMSQKANGFNNLTASLNSFDLVLSSITNKIDGINNLATSLSTLVQSMQEFSSLNSNINDIKPVLTTIHEIQNTIEPITQKTDTKVTTEASVSQTDQLATLIKEVQLLRKNVADGKEIYLDGKKVQRILANVTGIR